MKQEILAIGAGLALLLASSSGQAGDGAPGAPVIRAAGEGHNHGHFHPDAPRLGDLIFVGVQVRASIGNAPNSAAYVHIMTDGPADRLIAVSTPAAKRAELHVTVTDGATMTMQKVEAIEVTAETPAMLAPGGTHIMLLGLTERLKEGTTIELTLTFENAGSVTLTAPVQRIRSPHSH